MVESWRRNVGRGCDQVVVEVVVEVVDEVVVEVVVDGGFICHRAIIRR